ncbi:hypothetical protein LDENG_00240210 [Lucifuga dentata]|nr:hypothetical protein LDENG_00240210 [Lucifuga dentata]
MSRLNDCNALFTCLSKSSVAQLQLVQNSAARLLTKMKRSSRITSVLASLQPLGGTSGLQISFLAVPRSRLKTKGDRAFAVVALQLWNSLPLSLKEADCTYLKSTSKPTYFLWLLCDLYSPFFFAYESSFCFYVICIYLFLIICTLFLYVVFLFLLSNGSFFWQCL